MTPPLVFLLCPHHWGLPPYFWPGLGPLIHIHHSEDFPNLLVLENKHLCLEQKTKNKLKVQSNLEQHLTALNEVKTFLN